MSSIQERGGIAARKHLCLMLLLMTVVVGAAGQDQPVAGIPAAAKAFGPVDVSGILDMNYGIGFNHPADHINQLQNFDDKINQAELNMASVTLDMTPKPIGFHVELGVGRAFDIINTSEKDVKGMRFFTQAYAAFKPEKWGGLEVDFGKFASSASAEVIQTPNNWNYSRSLLFVWCTPDYHFGLRASLPVGRHFSAGAQLVSGWNNIVTGATFKTVGLTGTWTPSSKVNWSNTYYGGPDERVSNRGRRGLYDSVLQVSPNSKVSFYLNFDYLHDSPRFSPSYQVYGVAGAYRIQVTKKMAFGNRMEWFRDGSGAATGCSQEIREFTVTGRYALREWFSWWAEFREDRSDRPYFSRGNEKDISKNQASALVGMVVTVGTVR